MRAGGAPLPHLLLNPSRPAAPPLSPSRLRVGEALLQKLSTTCTAPSRCRSNPSLHPTCWTEEGGDVEVPHVCISQRHRHLRCLDWIGAREGEASMTTSPTFCWGYAIWVSS